jgi:hypothetical protein
MSQSIRLDVTHPHTAPGPIQGFRFIWAYYVNGYKPERHCQPCFRGRLVGEFCTRTATSGTPITLNRMDRYPYVYICGVGVGPDKELRFKNFHLPLAYREGAVVEATSYNGYMFRAENAVAVPIPALPAGWNGLSDTHTRCRNFQFAVAAFGYPPRRPRTANVAVVDS